MGGLDMLHQSVENNRFRPIKNFKDKPKCPIDPSHSITTNWFGEWVCENCVSHLDELKENIEIIKD